MKSTIDCDYTTNKDTTPNLPTNIVDFGRFDSSTILIYRGGILMSIGDFPEVLTRAMLVGTMLVGRLGIQRYLQESLQNIAESHFDLEVRKQRACEIMRIVSSTLK